MRSPDARKALRPTASCAHPPPLGQGVGGPLPWTHVSTGFSTSPSPALGRRDLPRIRLTSWHRSGAPIVTPLRFLPADTCTYWTGRTVTPALWTRMAT